MFEILKSHFNKNNAQNYILIFFFKHNFIKYSAFVLKLFDGLDSVVFQKKPPIHIDLDGRNVGELSKVI